MGGEAAPSAVQNPPPEVQRCFVSVSPSDRGPHHPRGRRTGRHRVKSGRAIISPLAAFEVYIPSWHLRSLREARGEKEVYTRAGRHGQWEGGEDAIRLSFTLVRPRRGLSPLSLQRS